MQKVQERQQKLLEIIKENRVFSQEELVAKLAEKGIVTTQATLSRDLRKLHIIKGAHEGYKVSEANRSRQPGPGVGVLRVEMNLPVCVIHTQVGYAPVVATYLDRHPVEPVMGTVAGDDTVIMAIRKGFTENQILTALSAIFPEIDDRFILFPEQ